MLARILTAQFCAAKLRGRTRQNPPLRHDDQGRLHHAGHGLYRPRSEVSVGADGDLRDPEGYVLGNVNTECPF
jgi:hypothetical protein